MAKLQAFGRSHPIWAVLIAVVVVGGFGVAWAAASMVSSFQAVEVDFSVPQAPQLTASGGDQTVYRIDASRSTVSYEVTEVLAGSDHLAVGTTSGVAGDILIDDGDPSASRIGEVVVDVKQLTSDEPLRDNRIRNEFLQSKEYPLATFETTAIDGMPDRIVDGNDYDVTVTGDLTIKDITHPATLDATARRDGNELMITASTTVTLADFDAGPIDLIGLVSTGEDAELTFDLVAVDATQFGGLTTVDVASASYGSDGPSFSRTVQPIIEQSCASCHQPNGPGASEWTVDTAADVADFASGLALVTETGYMPPWPASDAGIPLEHSMALSDEEIAAVVDWAAAGGPLDVAPDTEITPVEEDEIFRPRHDVELPIPEPYQGTPDLINDYRCFVLDPQLTDPTMITGYEFEPDNIEIVHHALVYRMNASTLEAIQQADDADDGPGWQCFGGINVPGSQLSPSGTGGGQSLMMGWAPGQVPTTFPEGTGMRLEPGDVFVVQMHYHVVEETRPDQSTLYLQIGEDPPDDYRNIKITTYLAPGEIPCFPEDADEPRCDRDAEIAEIGREYGPVGPAIANGLHLLCGTSPEEIGVLDEDGVASVSCDHRVRRAGELLAVLGHMHEIGLHYRMTLNPGTPDEKILLDIPKWDFDWQFNYAPVEDITLQRGDTLRVECSWDRHLADRNQEELHWVTWAEGTEDEMCFSTVATAELPSDANGD